MSSESTQFVRFDLPSGLPVSVLSTRKLKTVTVRFAFVADLAEDTVTRHALLPMVLRRGTQRLPDLQLIHRFLEGLYGASLDTSVQKIGEWHVARYRLDVVGDRFLPGEDGVLRRGLEFVRELITEPLVEADGLRPEYVEQEKANLQRAIESLIDSKSAWATQRLIETMCANEPYRIYDQGRTEDLDAIDAGELLDLQRRIVSSYPLAIHVVGDLSPVDARDLIADVFDESHLPRPGDAKIAAVPAAVSPGSPREVSDELDVQQARLHLGYRHGVTLAGDLDDHAAMMVMNGVLGGFSHSKLFQNVREKASLCYSVGSSIDGTKGLLFISSGIAGEDRDRALAIIREQVEAVQRGEVTPDEIDATVSTLINRNEMLEDDPAALAEVDFRWRLHGKDLDLDDLKTRVRRVTRDDIARAASRLELDTVYSLTATS